MVFSPQRIATGYQQLLPNKYITSLCFVWWYLSADGPSHIKYQHFRFNLRAGKSSNTSQPQIRSNFLCTFAMLSLLHTATCQYFVSQSSCFTAIEVLNETDKMALKRLAPKHRRGDSAALARPRLLRAQVSVESNAALSWRWPAFEFLSTWVQN